MPPPPKSAYLSKEFAMKIKEFSNNFYTKRLLGKTGGRSFGPNVDKMPDSAK